MQIAIHLNDADFARLPGGMRHALKSITVDHGRTIFVECSISRHEEVEIETVHLGDHKIEKGWELLDLLDLYETVSHAAFELAEKDLRAEKAEYALECHYDRIDREDREMKGRWF